MAVKCSKGHWYEPVGAGGCPRCAAAAKAESLSDDDVLAIMSSPQSGGGIAEEEAPKSSGGSSIMRRKKVCPECSHEASFSFVYCPRCGAPLKVASVELH
jgi:uncharacterized OB-fold protein